MREVVQRIAVGVIAQAARVDAEVEQPGDLGDVAMAQGQQGVAAQFAQRARLDPAGAPAVDHRDAARHFAAERPHHQLPARLLGGVVECRVRPSRQPTRCHTPRQRTRTRSAWISGIGRYSSGSPG